MGDSEMLEFNLEQLQQEEEERLKFADVICRRVYAKRVLGALRKLRLQRQTEKDVEDLLTGNKPLEDILNGRNGQWEGVIRNACTEYQGLKDMSFLLFVAPKDNEDISLKHDSQARELQLDHFYKMFVRGKDQSGYPKEVQTVKTYAALTGQLDNFMAMYGSSSKRAMIVFNGHGKDSGHLSLVSENKDISNTRFLEDIYRSWNKFKEKHRSSSDDEMILPTRVTVVLAHCYGYKHSLDDKYKSTIEVACLTNKHRPETKYVYMFNTIRSKIKASVHLDLTNFARDEVYKNREIVAEQDVLPHPLTESAVVLHGTESSEAMAPMAFMAFCEQNLNAETQLTDLKSVHISLTQQRLGDYQRMNSGEKGGTRALLTALAPFNLGSEISVDPENQTAVGTQKQRSRSKTQEGVIRSKEMVTQLGSPSSTALSVQHEAHRPSVTSKTKEKSEPINASKALLGTGMLAGLAVALDSTNTNNAFDSMSQVGKDKHTKATKPKGTSASVGATLGAKQANTREDTKQECAVQKVGKPAKAKKSDKKQTSALTALLASTNNAAGLGTGISGNSASGQPVVCGTRDCACRQSSGQCASCKSSPSKQKR